MWNDLTIGMYMPGDSLVHRLESRTKLAAVCLTMVAIFLAVDWPGVIALTALLLLAYRAASLPWGLALAGFRPLLWILVIALPLQLLLTAGEPLLSLGSLTVTREGVIQSGWLLFRLGALVFTASLLTLTTSPVALADGLEKLLKPLERVKLPAHELAMVITIALRFIPLFSEEADKISKAQKARGAEIDSGRLTKRIKALASILVPLLVGAFRRADELAIAMESRCYRGGRGRTRLRRETWGRGDFITLAATLILLFYTLWERMT
ncbi:MAG: energy-coupling factor transporter transmembrane protein EcfT [Firmicutes bacterium]|nr:energy-coupling factor transporter transmembrane protein EcfT [Bacillota bacterium]